jgi:hypothetical protein
MMGGQIDWNALPVICELLGVSDIEKLVVQLIVIRDKD